MKVVEVSRDEMTGLTILRDASDPPRYYLRERSRLDLISIGDPEAALQRFFARVSQATRKTEKSSIRRSK